VFCIDARAHEAVVALGLYFLESEYQYESLIVPYLIRLLKGLPKSIHKDDDPKILEKKIDSKCWQINCHDLELIVNFFFRTSSDRKVFLLLEHSHVGHQRLLSRST
jgi:hypothetical protein